MDFMANIQILRQNIGKQREKSLRIKTIADETVPIWPYLNIYYTLQ